MVVEATHTCMTIRGVRKPGSLCVTSAMKGIFRSNVSSRAEVMSLIYGHRAARLSGASVCRDGTAYPRPGRLGLQLGKPRTAA